MGTDVSVKDQSPVLAATPQTGIVNKEVPNIAGGLSNPEPIHNLDPKVEEMGVKVSINKPNLTSEHLGLGIRHVGPDIAVLPESPVQTVPMSKKIITEKQGEGDDSGVWSDHLMRKVADWEAKAK